jgi:hypothetical protein
MKNLNTSAKTMAAFFTGIFLTITLMAFSQNTPQPTPTPAPAPAQWTVEVVDMGNYTKNPNTRGGADPGGWAPGGQAQYNSAMNKMTSEGFEPFAASVYSKDRPNTYVTFFRKQK